MANINADVLRICDTSANLITAMREKQFGFATDTHKILVKAPGGTFYYLVAEGEDATYGDITVNGWAGYDADNSITFDGTTMQLKVIGSKILDFAASTIYINSSLSDHDVYLYGTGATPLLVSDAGNIRLGIKTTTPRVLLDIVDDTTNNLEYLVFADNKNTGNAAGGGIRALAVGNNVYMAAYSDNHATKANLSEIGSSATGTSVALIAGGTNEVMRLTATTKRVGINTTAPAEPLDVAGNVRIGIKTDATYKGPRITFEQYNSTAETEGFLAIFGYSPDASNNAINIGGGSSSHNCATAIRLYVAADTTTRTGTAILSATINGVGVGISSPSEKLEVDGDIKCSTDIHLSGAGSIYFGDESTDGSGRLRYDNSTQTFYLEKRSGGTWVVA